MGRGLSQKVEQFCLGTFVGAVHFSKAIWLTLYVLVPNM